MVTFARPFFLAICVVVAPPTRASSSAQQEHTEHAHYKDDIGQIHSELRLLASTRANFMGTAASQFVDSNTSPCPSNILEAFFQLYLKRMPTRAEVASASTPYGYVKIGKYVMDKFMATTYPSIVDGSALKNKVFALIGASSGWGFTASVLLAQYGATVHSCARTAAVFEGSKSTSMASYADYEADLARTDAYFEKHKTVDGYVQKYYPMYSGLLEVPSHVYDKIHFSECDVRNASSMVRFFRSVEHAHPSHQLDGVFFIASTYGSVNGVPRGTVITQESSLGLKSWTAPGPISSEKVVAATRNRSAPQILESPLLTMTTGETNAIDALIQVYGLAKARSVRFVLTGSFTSTSTGENFVAHASPFWGEYVGSRKVTMIRYESWINGKFNMSLIMPGGALTPLNGPVWGQFLPKQTAYTPFMSRLPVVVRGRGYNFVESARMYQKIINSYAGWNHAIPLPDVSTATMVPIIAATSRDYVGMRQVYIVHNLRAMGNTRTYDSVQPGGVGATDAWMHKIGSCAILDATATDDVESVMQADYGKFGPGPLYIHQGGAPSL